MADVIGSVRLSWFAADFVIQPVSEFELLIFCLSCAAPEQSMQKATIQSVSFSFFHFNYYYYPPPPFFFFFLKENAKTTPCTMRRFAMRKTRWSERKTPLIGFCAECFYFVCDIFVCFVSVFLGRFSSSSSSAEDGRLFFGTAFSYCCFTK